MARKKSYIYGDGTGNRDMSLVTPKLKVLIEKRYRKKLPSRVWVNVCDYSLWVKCSNGGFDVLNDVRGGAVIAALDEYEHL